MMMKQMCFAMLMCLALVTVSASNAQASKDAPKLKYFVFREDCYDKFVNKQDFSDQECLKTTISKVIGMAIIVGSGIVKLPQVVKIMRNGSVQGISAMTYYLETTVYMQTAAQAMSSGLPFSVYGENLIILVQNAMIMLLIFQYNKDIGMLEVMFVIGFFGAWGFSLFAGGFMTPELWQMVSTSNSVLSLVGKGPQLWTNFCNKSTGQMAFVTFLLNFLGGIARLGTVLFESDDIYFQI